MGGVLTTEQCPRCGSEETFHSEYRYKTGEDHGFCENCGYTYDLGMVRNEDGEPILNENGHWVFDEVEKNNYGIVIEAMPGGARAMSPLPTEEDFDNILTQIEELKKDGGLDEHEYILFRRYDGDKIVEKLLYENK